MTETNSAASLLEQIGAEQRRLRGLLAGRHPSLLAEPTPAGKWSVVENVRHLLFAEQAHLGRFLPGGPQWSALGLPPTGMQRQERFRAMATAAPSIEDVFDAWSFAHAYTRELADRDTGEVRLALTRNLKHLRSHVTIVERLLRVRAGR